METMTQKEVESRFICNSVFNNNFSELNFGKGKRAVLIINAKNTYICVIDINNLNAGEIVELVYKTLANITKGSNYKYEIVNIIDNVFFIN